MTKLSDTDKMLRDAGFELVREGKHKVWRKGSRSFTTHRGSKPDAREAAHARSTIRRTEEDTTHEWRPVFGEGAWRCAKCGRRESEYKPEISKTFDPTEPVGYPCAQ